MSHHERDVVLIFQTDLQLVGATTEPGFISELRFQDDLTSLSMSLEGSSHNIDVTNEPERTYTVPL